MSTPASVVGFLGDAPSLTTTQSGKSVARGRIGCPDEYRDRKGEMVERETFWVSFQAWGALAERLAELPKGAAIVGVGEWRQSNWTDGEGTPRTSRYVRLSSAGPDWSKRPKSEGVAPAEEQDEADTPTSATADDAEENPL